MGGDPTILDIAHQFKREEFTYQGNYRAIVENNADPENSGRVQVRIFGLHSPLSVETPVDHLPWASPCLNIAWSGGHNIHNTDKSAINTRYNPGNSTESTIPPKNSQQLQPKTGTFIDEVEDDCGTGGYFQVPRKGTIVWIFFENEDHTKCHYWSASTKKLDWSEQGKKITSDVNDKIDTVKKLRNEFIPDKEVHAGLKPADGAAVQTFCPKPRMSIYPIDGIPNQNMTSFTSANGTTFIVVNEAGNERIYIINKGYISHITEYGHKKELIGPTVIGGNTVNSNDEKLVSGHSELHVMGDYDVFTNGNCFFQVNGNVQINANKNVGVVSKSGDVDIVVEKGHCNIEVTKGNMNAHVGGNFQAKIDGDLNAKIDGNSDVAINGNLTAQITGKTSIDSLGDIALKTNGNMTLDSTGDFNILCNSMKVSSNTTTDITSPSGLNVNAGSSFKVDAGGFGGNIALYVPISNALHTGCYPGPGAGAGQAYTATAIAATPFIPTIISQFSTSNKTQSVSSGTTSNEKKDNIDVPGSPDITNIVK